MHLEYEYENNNPTLPNIFTMIFLGHWVTVYLVAFLSCNITLGKY